MTGTFERPLRFRVLGGRFAVLRLEAGAKVPAPDGGAAFFCATRTQDELSVVLPEESAPPGAEKESARRVLKLEGPFGLSLVGVLAPVLGALAEAGVPVFVVSTFETDYVLVEEERLEEAVSALVKSGCEVAGTGEVVVRPAREGDEGFLWEMLHEAVRWGDQSQEPEPPKEELLSRPPISRYLEGWGRPHDAAFVAVEEGTGLRVGAVWRRLMSAEVPGYGFVDEKTPEVALAVAPGFRGRGVGRRLLREMISSSREEGYAALSLSVERTNLAVGLYEKSGFEKLAAGEDDYLMKIELRSS